MNRAFSKTLAATEGRFMTSLEMEQALCSSLELPHRMLISKWIHQAEFEIVDYATQGFCDTVTAFDGPEGSIRRKKGHQDGRIVLRYLAQSIREGNTEIFFEKVLSWLVGHLDNGNVTGEHMEIFFHFLHQGTRRELPPASHPFIDSVFEEAMTVVRQATYSGTIHRAHRRIAEFTVDRVMTILPEVKAKYGVSSVPKCKRDVELLVKEVAKVMRSPSPVIMKEQLASWLVERLVNEVEYASEVWYWTLLALREGIVECCSPEASTAVSEMLESMADNIDNLLRAAKVTAMAGEIADQTATRLLERGEPLGLLRADEFSTTINMVDRQLVSQLAVLLSIGDLDQQRSRIANLWCNVVLPMMPSLNPNLLAANLKTVLEVIEEKADEATGKLFRSGIIALVEIARRTESAMRLAEVADKIAVEAADWAIDNLGAFAVDRRAAFRDLRIVMSKIISMVPAGPASVNGFEFRTYLAQFLLPNLPFNSNLLRQVYERLIKQVETHALPEDAKIARAYLDECMGCFDRHTKLRGIVEHAEKYTPSAVERGYQVAPRHESLQREGMKAGRRDGKFLLEKIVLAAVIGGVNAEVALHEYFIHEQVRFSKLPGSVIAEFLRGLLEQLRDFPEVSELIMNLATAAPMYAGAYRLVEHSQDMAAKVAHASIQKSTGYRDQIGDGGVEACARDTSVTLRGLSHFLLKSPCDVTPFREWWKRRIGKNIRSKPSVFESTEVFAKSNFDEIVGCVQSSLDRSEADAITAYIEQLFVTRSNNRSNETLNQKKLPKFGANVMMSSQIVTYADIGV